MLSMILFVNCNAFPSVEMGIDPTAPSKRASKREIWSSTLFMKASSGSETEDNLIFILDTIAAPVLSSKSIAVSKLNLV